MFSFGPEGSRWKAILWTLGGTESSTRFLLCPETLRSIPSVVLTPRAQLRERALSPALHAFDIYIPHTSGTSSGSGKSF